MKTKFMIIDKDTFLSIANRLFLYVNSEKAKMYYRTMQNKVLYKWQDKVLNKWLNLNEEEKIDKYIEFHKFDIRKDYIEVVMQDILKSFWSSDKLISSFASFASNKLADIKIYGYNQINHLYDDINYTTVYYNNNYLSHNPNIDEHNFIFHFFQYYAFIDFISVDNFHDYYVNRNMKKPRDEDKIDFEQFIETYNVDNIAPDILATEYNYLVDDKRYMIEELNLNIFDKSNAEKWLAQIPYNTPLLVI